MCVDICNKLKWQVMNAEHTELCQPECKTLIQLQWNNTIIALVFVETANTVASFPVTRREHRDLFIS